MGKNKMSDKKAPLPPSYDNAMGMETKPVPQSVVTNVQYVTAPSFGEGPVTAARRRLRPGRIRSCHQWAGYSPLCSVWSDVGRVVLYLAVWIVCRLQPILAQVATSPSAGIIQARQKLIFMKPI